MSRSREDRARLDGGARREASDRDMPRGGRSGGSTRGRQPAPADVRDALTQQLDLPRGETRTRIDAGVRQYDLRGAEVRTLAVVGAFRVADVRDVSPRPAGDRWHGDVEHLRQEGLIRLTPHVLAGERTALVTLTAAGQALLEQHRHPSSDQLPQAYYAGLAKPREASHDAQLARLYAQAAERLQTRGSRISRVVVDYELKREYQRFLQAHNCGRRDASGRPDRSPDEVRAWAATYGLPVVAGRVQFPDVRIEYETRDGERAHEDLELSTGHYNSRQLGAKRAAGFSVHHSTASHLKGGSGRRGGAPFDPHAAEQVLR